MAERVEVDICQNSSILDEEDEATLMAIDEGIRQANEGQLIPIDEVRKLIPQWISKFSTPQQH